MNRFGLSDDQVTLIREVLVAPLIKAGCKVFVFGSRARGDNQKFSDLDILVEGPVAPETLSHITETLEESSLPFRVDVVALSDLAESYRAGVLKDRIEINERSL